MEYRQPVGQRADWACGGNPARLPYTLTPSSPRRVGAPAFAVRYVAGTLSQRPGALSGRLLAPHRHRLRVGDDSARGADSEFLDLGGLAVSSRDELVKAPGIEPPVRVSLDP